MMFEYVLPCFKFANATLIGLISLIAFTCNTTSAQTARATGAATLTVLGVTSTVSGEIALPPGLYFGGPAVVTPTYGTGLVQRLTIDPGTVVLTPTAATFSRSAADILTRASNGTLSPAYLEQVSAIIRAGAGADGLD